MAFLAPVVAWIGANLGTIATVASVASTVYSAYSSEQAEGEATKERREARTAAGQAAAKAEKISGETAGLSEATRIRKRRAMASTIRTSPEGLTETPTVGKQTLGD